MDLHSYKEGEELRVLWREYKKIAMNNLKMQKKSKSKDKCEPSLRRMHYRKEGEELCDL